MRYSNEFKAIISACIYEQALVHIAEHGYDPTTKKIAQRALELVDREILITARDWSLSVLNEATVQRSVELGARATARDPGVGSPTPNGGIRSPTQIDEDIEEEIKEAIRNVGEPRGEDDYGTENA
jgi:hypothetical protein